MHGAVGGILTVLLALACLTILGGALADYAARSDSRDPPGREFRGSLLLGTGVVTLLNVVVRLI